MSREQDLSRLAGSLPRKARRRPPVLDWHPERSGEIDIRIAADGSWHHLGSPIRRQPLVQLFASILRRDEDGYYLVTPVEKLRIAVEDAPFVAVALEARGSGPRAELHFTTNVGDEVIADAAHPLWVVEDRADGAPRPYLRVRDRLDALISRSVYYQLVELGRRRRVGDRRVLAVRSRGEWFTLGALDDAD